MEGAVRRDHLWTSLQLHLSNPLRANSPVPAMLWTFETCCTVIDTALVALENSDVDRLAPEFGLLAHYLELFATDCFSRACSFIERAIDFRVGLIKVRFCRAVLTQFLGEFIRESRRQHGFLVTLGRRDSRDYFIPSA